MIFCKCRPILHIYGQAWLDNYRMRKDHKNVNDHNVGPPVRPVCGAVTAYNRKLSHLIRFILAEVWKEEESVCLNTEEMLAGFKQLKVIMLCVLLHDVCLYLNFV